MFDMGDRALGVEHWGACPPNRDDQFRADMLDQCRPASVDVSVRFTGVDFDRIADFWVLHGANYKGTKGLRDQSRTQTIHFCGNAHSRPSAR